MSKKKHPVHQWSLGNGLRVVCQHMPLCPSVSVGVWVGAGSLHERQEDNGSAHFLEHMLFKRTQTRTAREIAREMDAIGGQVNAFTEKECTCFHARVIPEHLPRALALLADLLLHPALDEQEFETERGVILEEIAMGEDDPEGLADEKLAEALFGAHPLARPILGKREGIQAMTRAALLGYRKRHYRPDNTVLAIAGNLPDPGVILEMAEGLLGAWQGEGNAPQEEEALLGKPRVIKLSRPFEQVQLALGWPAPARGSSALPAAWALSALLAEGNDSRLFQRIREQMGAAYNLYSDVSAYPKTGVFAIQIGTSSQESERVLDALFEEIHRLLEQGLAPQELHSAQAQLRIACVLADESSADRMDLLGRSLLLRGRVVPAEETLQAIDALRTEDVDGTAAQIFASKPAAAMVGRGVRRLSLVQRPTP